MRKALVTIAILALCATPVMADNAIDDGTWFDGVIQWIVELFDEPGDGDPDFGPVLEPGG